MAVFAPLLVSGELANKMYMTERLQGPSLAHPLGTDQLGRDLLFRVVLGSQTSLLIAVSAVLTSIVIGLPLGLVSGYYGGHIDNVLMRLVDTLLAFPALLLALTISAMLGPNLQNTIIAIGDRLHAVPRPHRARRGAARGADALCRGGARLRHQRPHDDHPAHRAQHHAADHRAGDDQPGLRDPRGSGLSFLGLGTQPPNSSWGLMIQTSRDYLDRAPWTALVPGAAVALAVLGLNMFGDVLRDVLDPRTK